MALDENFETFVVHVTFFNLVPLSISVYPYSKTQIVCLLIKEIKILDEYLDFVDVFLKKKALMLSERTKLNAYAIYLENGK